MAVIARTSLSGLTGTAGSSSIRQGCSSAALQRDDWLASLLALGLFGLVGGPLIRQVRYGVYSSASARGSSQEYWPQ